MAVISKKRNFDFSDTEGYTLIYIICVIHSNYIISVKCIMIISLFLNRQNYDKLILKNKT